MKEIILALVGTMLLIGCNPSSSKKDEVGSKLQRELNPNVSEAELKQLVIDNNKFAFSLFQKLDDKPENLFFSPISISHALLMTYAGAEGKTKDEMKTALHVTLDDSKVHKAFNKLDLTLNFKNSTDIFKIANSIWPSNDFKFTQNYLDTIMVNYGTSLKTLDYANNPQESRKTINSWVEDKTEDKIKELIPKGSITKMTKMVLTNATYFRGNWENPFDKNQTKKGVFDNTLESDFMYQREIFEYYENPDLEAIKLNYKTGKNSMVILLPKSDKLPSLTQEYLESIESGFSRYKVTLSMPKFKFTSNSISLSKTMKEFGMNSAFDTTKAEFTKLSPNGNLYISDIIHKAFISVDELGSEAAAATATLISTTGIEIVPHVDMTVDRPFVYIIKDNETNQILFLGHMKKP